MRRARANPRSLMLASYHNLISVDIWGEPMGRRGPCKGRNTGGRPWIFTILIIVSAWDPDATRQLAISPSNPPSIGQFSFRMTDHVSDGHRGGPRCGCEQGQRMNSCLVGFWGLEASFDTLLDH